MDAKWIQTNAKHVAKWLNFKNIKCIDI